MKAYEIVEFIENEYPLVNQRKDDNSGLQFGSLDKDVKKVAVAYEKTIDVIQECIRCDYDFLITHRPLSIPKRFGPPPRIWWNLFRKTIDKKEIIIYSVHDNLDLGRNNTALCLSNALRLTAKKQIGEYLICKTDALKFKDFIDRIKKLLKPIYLVAIGNPEFTLNTIGIVAGTAIDVKDIEFFVSSSVDCYLSGDIDDFGIRYARDLGLMTVNVDDYCLERPGILSLYNLLLAQFGNELNLKFIDCRIDGIS